MADPKNMSVLFDRTNGLVEALERLARSKVMVGIPADAEQPHLGAGTPGPEVRTSGGIGNAALGYIHETGSPGQNIPARPFLVPGVELSQARWLPHLKAAATAAANGAAPAVEQEMHKAGLVAVSAVKNRIVAGIPPPLAPATIAARRRRSPGSKYRRKAQTASQVTPLVDTGQLLNSLSYVVRKKPK